MDKKTFINQVGHLFKGQVLYAFTQWFVLFMLARFGGDAESGIYVAALATTAPIFMLFDLNLRVSRSTDHQHGEQYRTYVGIRFCCLVLAVAVSLLTCLFLYDSRIGVFIAIILYRVGESISNLSFGGYQRMQVSDRIGKTLTVKGFVALSVLGVLIPLTGNAIYAALAMAIISFWFALLRDLPNAWKMNEPDCKLSVGSVALAMKDFEASRRIVRRSLPLGFDAFISSLAFNSPRYAIQYWVGTSALGVFGVLSQFAWSLQLLVGAVGHAGVSVLSKHRMDNNRKQFWRLFNRMLASSAIAGVIAVAAGSIVIPRVIGYFLGPQYNNFYLVLGLLAASCLAGGLRTAGRATQATGEYFAYLMFDVVVFAVSAIASIIFVQIFGLNGGAIALVLAFGSALVVALVHTYRFLWPEENEMAQESV